MYFPILTCWKIEHTRMQFPWTIRHFSLILFPFRFMNSNISKSGQSVQTWSGRQLVHNRIDSLSFVLGTNLVIIIVQSSGKMDRATRFNFLVMDPLHAVTTTVMLISLCLSSFPGRSDAIEICKWSTFFLLLAQSN